MISSCRAIVIAPRSTSLAGQRRPLAQRLRGRQHLRHKFVVDAREHKQPLGPDAHLPARVEHPEQRRRGRLLEAASSHTIIGSLPPSSRITGVSVSAAAAITLRPFCGEPVKKILSAPEVTSAEPVSP
jgi:hypothetical protein